MISNPCIEVQTSPVDRRSVPAWFAEVVIIAQHLGRNDLLDAFAHQIRLVRGRFGTYEPIDFLALLVGYAISGERTLADFFERVVSFEPAFIALFGRRRLPHRATLSPPQTWVNSRSFSSLSLRGGFSGSLRDTCKHPPLAPSALPGYPSTGDHLRVFLLFFSVLFCSSFLQPS